MSHAAEASNELTCVKILHLHSAFRIAHLNGREQTSAWSIQLKTMTDVRKQVGMAIRRLRHKQGVTQQALAERLQVYRTYLSGVESGQRNPTIQTLSRFAEALGVPLIDLFRNNSQPHTAIPRKRRRQ